MSTKMRLLAMGLVGAGAALLFACGGGSSGGSAPATGGSAGTVTSASGVVSAFGSVFVNGVEYQYNNSTSVVDDDNNGAASSASALRVGMTVDVSADATGKWADVIHFSSAVRGEVDAVDSTTNTLTVLGQPVQVSSGTSFAGSVTSGATSTPVTQLGNISVGNYVVVYGFLECTSSASPCTSTQVVATLIYVPATATVYRVAGYAQNASSSSASFTIDGLTVDYATTGSGATACLPYPCAISNGEFVVARSMSAPTGSGSTLTLAATTIRQASQLPVYTAGSTVSIAGPVSQLGVSSADSFVLRGVEVDGSAVASTVGTLSDGEIVVVTGTVQGDGSIAATAISIVQHATFALMGPLGADSASAGTITVLGQTFTLTNSTRFGDWAEQGAQQGMQSFNLSNFATVLAVGDQLIVSGYPTASGNVATRVELIPTPSSPTAGAEGVVSSDSSSADTLVIGGVSVVLSSSTTLFYPGAGSSASLSGFFAAVTPGTSVAWVLGTPGSSETASATIDATFAAAMPLTCRWASPY